MRSDRRSAWLFAAALLWSVASLWTRGARSAVTAVVPPERLRRAGLLALAGLLLGAPLAAQEASPEELEIVVPGPDMTMAGLARYDGAGRRDPFTPLFEEASGGGSSGPRLELLRLTGVFEGSGSNGLVVLEDPSHRGHFVRLGQQVGNARLVEILPQAAVFEVRDYGVSRRVVLRLERTEERR